MSENILEVKNLHVSFKTYAGISHAVRGVDFSLRKGETLAIVGESGCGKTVTSKAIMGLLPAQNTRQCSMRKRCRHHLSLRWQL